MNSTPPGYEEKFANFIRMCAELKATGVGKLIVASPRDLGDNYEEIVESLSRLAEAELSLHIAAREYPASRN